MSRNGKILIKSPQWYLAASKEQGFSSNQMSSDFMFDMNSKVKVLRGPENFSINENDSSFIPAIGIFTISFTKDKDGWTDEVEL